MGTVIGEILPLAVGEAVSPIPKWMAAIDQFNAGKAAGLGFALAAAVFSVLAACTVAVPVIAYAVAAERMRGPLDRLKVWLQSENATVMSVLLLVIAAVMVGKGLGGLL